MTIAVGYFVMPTMMLFIAATHGIVGLLMVVYGSRREPTGAMAVWSAANLVAGVAWAALALRSDIPAWISIAVGNALLIGSWALLVLGMRRFAGRRTPAVLVLLPGLIVFVLFVAVPPVRDNLGARVLVVNVFLLLSLLALAAVAWRDQRREPLRARWVVLISVLIAVASNGVRAVSAFGLRPDQGFLSSGIVQEVGIFVQGLCLVGWSFGLLLMIQERLENRLRDATFRDPLTGLLNRRGLAEALATSAAPGEGELRAALLIDLDEFKGVNDRYGHAAGDRVLVDVAAEIGRFAGAGDVVSRHGGEEFCVLTLARDHEALTRRAEELRATVAGRRWRFERDTVGVTVSIGAALAPAVTGPDVDALLADADAALYRAKRAGRDRVATGTGARYKD